MAAPAHPPYTPVVRAGDWVIVSGQLGMKDGAIVPGGVRAQTQQAVINLKAQLATMGATIDDIAKTLCFLTDMDTFPTFNEMYASGFGKARPARSTIGVKELPFGGAVEIEAWAYLPVAAKEASQEKSSKEKGCCEEGSCKEESCSEESREESGCKESSTKEVGQEVRCKEEEVVTCLVH
jgi:2-iminobutanoate/2-iminopropanoate deaminase